MSKFEKLEEPRDRAVRYFGSLHTWYTEHDFHIRVQGDTLGPIVPSAEVEVILSTGTNSEGLDTTVVVVKLHPNNVEIHGTGQHGSVRCVGVGTLRCRSQEPLFTCVRIHQRTELVSESRHVGDSGLEVEVESIDNTGSEWPRG